MLGHFQGHRHRSRPWRCLRFPRAQLRRADMEKHHGSELQHRSASIMQERTRKWLAMLRAAAHNVNGMRL